MPNVMHFNHMHYQSPFVYIPELYRASIKAAMLVLFGNALFTLLVVFLS